MCLMVATAQIMMRQPQTQMLGLSSIAGANHCTRPNTKTA